MGGEVGVSFGWIVGSLWIAMAKAEVTVLKNASIVTMDGEMRVYVGNGAMVVEGENIIAIGKTEDVLRVYESKADIVLDLSSRWILPGIPHPCSSIPPSLVSCCGSFAIHWNGVRCSITR